MNESEDSIGNEQGPTNDKPKKSIYNFEEKQDNKSGFQGILCQQVPFQAGQKPPCKSFMGVVSMGGKFIVYGGTAANVYNDIRSLDDSTREWKIIRSDVQLHDFPARFAHSMGIFERYLVIFGGCGPYQHKLKKRNCF